MLQLTSFTFNPFQENTYLLSNEAKEAIIIDPGMYESYEMDELLAFMNQQELTPTKVLLTHAHLDHIFGLHALLQHVDIPFFLHEKEIPIYVNGPASAARFGVELRLPTRKYELISENEKIAFGDAELEIRLAPGHSPGSVCFYSPENKWVIAGDVLFQQSIGRTDLPGGDFDTLIRSIQTQLFTLDDATRVYAGHGPSTTIGLEKMNNPFLRN